MLEEDGTWTCAWCNRKGYESNWDLIQHLIFCNVIIACTSHTDVDMPGKDPEQESVKEQRG